MAQQPLPDYVKLDEPKVPDYVKLDDSAPKVESKPEPRGFGLRDVAALGIRGLSAFVPGGPLGALAGGIGEGLAQTIEPRESYNLPQIGVQAGLGAIPFGRVASVGKGLMKGGVLGATGVTATELAETGELPSAGKLALGVGIGAGGGGLASRVPVRKGNLAKVADSITTPRKTDINLPTKEPTSLMEAQELGELAATVPAKPPSVMKLEEAVSLAKSKIPQQKKIYTAERAEKVGKARDISEGETPEELYQQLGQLKGEHTRVGMEPIKLNENEVSDLFKQINSNTSDFFGQLHAKLGLLKLTRGEVPQESQLKLINKYLGTNIEMDVRGGKIPSLVTELINTPKAFWSTIDMSAPLRQGLPLITRKEWWSSLDDMFKAYGSEKNYRAVMDTIENDSLFGQAMESGLKLTDLGKLVNREEIFLSRLPEKIPGFRVAHKASQRAYTGFLDKLRYDTYKSLVTQSGSENNLVLSSKIADFVNNATGRGSLGKLEQDAVLLNNLMFSPRLVASRIQMLNPYNYTMQPKFVRQQYLKSALSIAGAWTTFASLGALAGADVSLDPSNSDFGKIKIGNTRIDPAGGFQQFLVLANRLTTGKSTSSVSEKESDLSNPRGILSPTYASTIGRFAESKASPAVHFALALARPKGFGGAPRDIPAEVIDLFVPLIVQDINEVAQQNPDLLPITTPAAFFGMGSQTYERGSDISVGRDITNSVR